MGTGTLKVVGLGLLAASAATGLGCNGGDLTPPPTTGTLTITTTTSGVDPDADGYGIVLDGGTQTFIASSGTIQRDEVQLGNHSVLLTGMAANCTVEGDNPRQFTILAGETTNQIFEVACITPQPGTGSLTITTATTGTDQDTDGYSVAVDGGSNRAIGISETVSLANVPAGPHTVLLSGVSANCTLGETNPRTVTVPGGATVPVIFAVTCAATTASLIAFTSGDRSDPSVYIVRPDGTALTRLAAGSSPVWSPDKSKILFLRSGDLYVMNADGSRQAKLAEPGPQYDTEPGEPEARIESGYRWSPDGSRITYPIRGCFPECKYEDLWMMNADGSEQTGLAGMAAAASWAPDGKRIAYLFVADEYSEIHIINADGTGDIRLANTPYAGLPDWSADGRHLLFSMGAVGSDIFVMNPDGSGLLNLTPGAEHGFYRPTWSPDGTSIALSSLLFSNDQLTGAVVVMNADGSGRAEITPYTSDFDPVWSPDGRQIVFTRGRGTFLDGDRSNVIVVNADGSGEMEVSGGPLASEPSW